MENLFPRARRETGSGSAGRRDHERFPVSSFAGDREVPPYSHPLVTLLRRPASRTCSPYRASTWRSSTSSPSSSCGRRMGASEEARIPDLNLLASAPRAAGLLGLRLPGGAPTPAVRSAGMITIAVLLWRRLESAPRGSHGPDASPHACRVADGDRSPSFLLSYGATFS